MNAKDIARTFSRNLLAEIGEENLNEVIARNAKETSKGVCHSHDFCDANMVMDGAMKMYGIADPSDENNHALWNEAWDIAVKNCFFVPDDGKELLEVMHQVVAILRNRNIKASVEYPGFISIGDKSFGTVNETWGWNAEDGTDDGGDFEIPSESTDAEKIAATIIEFLS